MSMEKRPGGPAAPAGTPARVPAPTRAGPRKRWTLPRDCGQDARSAGAAGAPGRSRPRVTSEMLFVFAVALGALAAFVKEWWSSDSTALVVLLVLVAGGALTPAQAFAGFGNEALATVAAMFVLSAGLTRTGAVERVGRAIERFGGRSEPRILLALMTACCLASAFINNTPIAVVFLPIVLGIADRSGIAGSKFLIPMSYATIVGGMATVIGTSTNVLVSGRLQDAGMPPMHLFEPLPLALAGAVMTVLYIVLLGRRWLPSNTTVSSAAAGTRTTYLTELTLPPGSPLCGRTLGEAILAPAPGLRVLQVIRQEEILVPRSGALVLQEGDTLLARGDADALLRLHRAPGVDVGQAAMAPGLTARARESLLAELLVRPTSGAIGARVGDLMLHARHGVVVLAVQREGQHIREKVADIRLRLGDVLLVQGEHETLGSLAQGGDFVLLEGVAERVVLRDRAVLAAAITVAVVVCAALEVLPISLLALAGSLAMVAAGCLTAREAYRAVDLPLLVLMAGTIGLGRALETSGGAAWLARGLVDVAHPWGDRAVLSAVYLACNVLTALISNAAAAVIMLPIGLAVASASGMHSTPFIMAVMFAASIDFSTPIGYQTNTFVYGPGGYRFSDYLKVGGPLNLLWWALATALIPALWPLRG